MKISFDFDNTLSTHKGQQIAKHFIDNGDELFVVTARNESESGPVYEITDKLGIPKSHVYFAGSNKSKIDIIDELHIQKHFDDNQSVRDELNRMGIKSFKI